MEYCKIYLERGTLLIYIMAAYYDAQSGEHIELRIERAGTEDFARFILPAYFCSHSFGFSEDELLLLEQFLRNNAVLIWEMVKEGYSAESIA